MQKYSLETEKLMQSYYSSLSEKARRHYASVESLKLEHGGRRYIGKLFNISQKTLRKGIAEITNPELRAQIPAGKERRAGGGRKKKKFRSLD